MLYAIEINNLYKQYKGALAPAVDGLSLKVKKNQVVGLLGPNGAGKTTSINIMCGLIMPDEGNVQLLGKDAIKETQEVRKVIGVVPQQIALFPHLTARENLNYIGSMYGLEKKVMRERINNYLQEFGLEKHGDKRIIHYSGGMKRRANIIASLLHDPELLILDEPTAGVDIHSRAMIIEFIIKYKQQGKTILYTSHLLEEAQKVCDEVVIIDEGKYIAGGETKELIKETNNCHSLEEVFLHYTGKVLRD